MPKAKKAGGAETQVLSPLWWVYVLLCRDGTLYCGITTDKDRRLRQHNAGTGARYTRVRTPVTLEGSWSVLTRSEALKAEYALKRLTRAQKVAKLSELKKTSKPTRRSRRKKLSVSS